MPKTFLFLPPANETIRAWAAHLDGAVPELPVVIAESIEQAQHEIQNADAAFGTLPLELLIARTVPPHLTFSHGAGHPHRAIQD
jgi:hypothetical protein